MRINKYIAEAGICSRRKADELINNGNVKVNGITLKEPGYDVKEGDVVSVNGNVINPVEEKVYLALNKPLGYITSIKDQFDRPTVMDLVTDVEGRLFPVGRLDYNTTGLLIMTNDGDWAQKVAHPKHGQGKTYIAKINGFLTEGKLNRLRKGIDIGGFVTSPAEVEVMRELPKQTEVKITIHEGRYRQVRKMFKAVGTPVLELERVAIGDVKPGRLAVGGYRKLTKKEIESLSK